MKAIGKRKASKVTFKKHRKQKLLPKEGQALSGGEGLKPDDLINRERW